MPQCNISHKGRVWRFFLGMLLFFLGSMLFVVARPGNSIEWRVFQLGIMFLGIFMLFEGALGWCALRALMGRKSP